MRIAVLVACYNRVETTVRGLSCLREELRRLKDVDWHVYLLDDASTDGTGKQIRALFEEVTVIKGSGSLFWNGGMHTAYKAARRDGSFDAYLLFNDDVVLMPDRIFGFFADYRAANAGHPAILVGAMKSSAGDAVTYGGMRVAEWWRALSFSRVVPNGSLQVCDAFNGNFVLVPGAFFEKVGGVDPAYIHAYGDIDLGLTAKKVGVDVVLWRYAIGVCDIDRRDETKKNWFMVFISSFTGVNDIRQSIHFVWKHKPKLLFPYFVLGIGAKRTGCALRNVLSGRRS